MIRTLPCLARFALAALVLSMLAAVAAAQETTDFDLPRQSLADSLRAIAARTRTNILFERSHVAGRMAPELRVHATLDQALDLALVRTGLTYRYLGDRTILIVPLSRPKRRDDASTTATTSDAGRDTRERGLEEIVVTAERRSTDVQDTAASIVAFTPETLDASEIWNASDLQLRTPGLLVSNNGVDGQLYLRGVGSDIINPGADSPIAVFIDGAYQARQVAALTDLYDMERVEVLKGPQGTLYGRNASGGAVNLITHDPDPVLTGAAEVTFGNYDARRLRAMINVPLSNGWAFRAAGLFSQHDGYTRNALDGTRMGDEDLAGVRAKLKYAAGERFSFVLGAEYTHESDSRLTVQKVLDTPTLPLPVRDLAARFGYPPPAIPPDPFVVEYDAPPKIHLRQQRLNATARWRLGHLELTSISAYTHLNHITLNDLDATGVDFAYDHETSSSRAFTQTVHVSADSTGPLRWMAGLEYFDEHAAQDFDARLPPFGPPSPIAFGPDSPVAGFVWDSSLRTHAAAGFVEGDLALSNQWTLNAGMRYSWEQKEANLLQTVVDPLGEMTGSAGTVVRPAQPERTFTAWTPKVRLEYRPARRVLVYASVTRGFKSGGFNLMNQGETFEPEKLWSLESGLKATWLDNRLRTNAAAFHYDYDDLQVNQFAGVTNIVTNAATSRITGIEMQIAVEPTPGLQADLAVALLNGTYHRYRMLDANDPQVTLDLSGNRMPHAPRATLVTGLEQEFFVAGGVRLRLRGEARYQSLTYFDQLDAPQLAQGGYTLLNTRVLLSTNNPHWSLAFYGRNLGNKGYRQSVVRVDNVFGTTMGLGTPRTYGVQLTTQF